MSWLIEGTGDDSTRSSVLALMPGSEEQLERLKLAAWQATEPQLLQIAARHVAEIIGADVNLPVGSEGSSPRERAVAEFAEQFAVDPGRIRHDERRELADQIGTAGLFNLVQSLNVIDGYMRFCATTGVVADLVHEPDGPGDELFESGGSWSEDPEELERQRLELMDPRLLGALAAYSKFVHSHNAVDLLTGEAVRLRNAQTHGCHY